MNYKVLALDLEGTLISNAVSIFVRPHLYEFLQFCRKHFQRIVIFSSVSNHRVKQILKILTDENSVPGWFIDLEVVEWKAEKKDLRFIRNCNLNEVLIIDDQENCILDDQKSQFIKISEWLPPFENSKDMALLELQKTMEKHYFFDQI